VVFLGKIILQTCLVTATLIVAVLAIPQSTDAADSWRKLYEASTYRDTDGRNLPYRLLKPEKIERSKSYPLVLFLHGGGENGSDNDLQLYIGAKDFAKAENRRKYPCFVVFPHCPADNSWGVGTFGLDQSEPSERPRDALDSALELVDKLTAKLPIDKRRVYVTGLCTGGIGTWNALARRPKFFAAAIPICGTGDPDKAAIVKKVPIWAFHGDKDPVVPVENTRDMIAAIRKAGGHPKMTIYPSVKHNSWSATYGNPEVIAWLFAQKRKK
jgi:predicted peptidase